MLPQSPLQKKRVWFHPSTQFQVPACRQLRPTRHLAPLHDDDLQQLLMEVSSSMDVFQCSSFVLGLLLGAALATNCLLARLIHQTQYSDNAATTIPLMSDNSRDGSDSDHHRLWICLSWSVVACVSALVLLAWLFLLASLRRVDSGSNSNNNHSVASCELPSRHDVNLQCRLQEARMMVMESRMGFGAFLGNTVVGVLATNSIRHVAFTMVTMAMAVLASVITLVVTFLLRRSMTEYVWASQQQKQQQLQRDALSQSLLMLNQNMQGDRSCAYVV